MKEIDLSKVSNLEAAKATDTTFEKVVSNNRKNKKSKFDFRTEETIPLPSRGLLYKNVTDDKDILNGFIKMYPMTVKEEEILSTSKFLKNGTATRMILDRCIVSDIDAKDILLFDSNFLMFYLRSISYGDSYEFDIKCESSSCERKFKHEVKISKLEFDELDNIKEPINVKLPNSKFTVSFILPRLVHSEELIIKNKNIEKSSDEEDSSLVDNLLITTVKIIDNNKEEVDEKDWKDFYESIIGKDRATLKEASEFSANIDKIDHIVCPYCETEQSFNIPIGLDFFRF